MKFPILVILSLFLSVLLQAQDYPNVLLIISDDLNTKAISSYGNPDVTTSNIDRLGSEGTLFRNAYSQYPVCGPSRASILFGYYPNATKTYGYTSGRENVGNRRSLPQLFKDNGYYTARVSKIFHMGVPIDIEKGSDGKDDAASWTERFNSQGPEWQATGETELVQGNPDGSAKPAGGNHMIIVKGTGDDLEHSDSKTTAKAIQLLREKRNKPFFIAIGYVRPHVPFAAPKRYFTPFPFEQTSIPKKIKNDWLDIPERGINYVTSKNAKMTIEQQKKAVAAYYASVAFIDDQVGQVLQTLEDEGLAKNTIVVFTSDHGFHLGEHDFWMKVSLHEESVKVPLIIKVPGKQPQICDSFAELLDLYPTLAQLAGLEIPKNLQGKSLVRTLDDPLHVVREMAFSVSQGGRSFMLRDKTYAYIQYNEDASAGMELYDMTKDAQQFNNLALLPKYQAVVNRFQKELRKKLEDIRKNDLGHSYP